MSKGISTIIAAILLLIITIGLAGAAYMFISTMLTGTMSKVINVLDVSCVKNDSRGNITIVLANDGTVDINDSEIIVTVDNVIKSDNFDFGLLEPHTSNVSATYDSTGFALNEVHTVLVSSPSNAVRVSVWC